MGYLFSSYYVKGIPGFVSPLTMKVDYMITVYRSVISIDISVNRLNILQNIVQLLTCDEVNNVTFCRKMLN